MSTVLVVDDAPEVVLLVAALLSTVPGVEVRTAGNGPDGLAEARALLPDLVLLDLELPGMDGPEVLAALRADGPARHVPVLLFTGGRERSAAELQALGADGQLRKPFTADALLEAVLRRLPGERAS